MVTVTARLRWDEANELPQTRVSQEYADIEVLADFLS